jgi:ribosomal protein L7Ae-like RNA K-turn-binding protein
MWMQDRVYSMLGLAIKAGKLASGEETCEKIIRSGKAKAILVCRDASDNTKKKFKDMATFRTIPIRLYGEKQGMGQAIGKGSRAVVVVLEDHFAKKILELLEGQRVSGGEAFDESTSL